MTAAFKLPRTLIFKEADFDPVFKTRNKKFGSFFVVYARPIPLAEGEIARRLGMAVSKKSVGNNVKRNLVRRIIREVYRHQQHELPNLQILVVGMKDLKKRLQGNWDRAALRADLEKLLQRTRNN